MLPNTCRLVLPVLSAPGPIKLLVIFLPVPIRYNALIAPFTLFYLSFSICSMFLCRTSLYFSGAAPPMPGQPWSG